MRAADHLAVRIAALRREYTTRVLRHGAEAASAALVAEILRLKAKRAQLNLQLNHND